MHIYRNLSGQIPLRYLDEDFAELDSKIGQASSYYAVTVGGGANAITISINATITEYTNGLSVAFIANYDNTSDVVTVNVNNIGAVQVKRDHYQNLRLSDIKAGMLHYITFYNNYWILRNPHLGWYHASKHYLNGDDPLTGDLDANARLKVQKAGNLIGTRRKINFTDTGILTFSLSDDAANERVNITASIPVSFCYKTTDQSLPAGSYTDITGLSFNVSADKFYQYQFYVAYYSGSYPTTIYLSLVFPSGIQAGDFHYFQGDYTTFKGGSITSSGEEIGFGLEGYSPKYLITFKGILVPSADGVIKLRGRRGDNIATVSKGSCGLLFQVG